MKLRCGKNLDPVGVVYLQSIRSTSRMAPAARVSRVPDRRTSDTPATTSGLDLATRLRTLERAARSRVERRDALGDMVRAVNTTLEPPKIAEQVVERAATWIPAPCWAIVSADLAGELSVLAERGLAPEMGPTVYKIAGWVMQRGQEFFAADASKDSRVRCDFPGALVALRGRSEEHTSELQSPYVISYAVFSFK